MATENGQRLFQIVVTIIVLAVVIALLASSMGEAARTRQAQQRSIRIVVHEIRDDFAAHARGAAIRSCALAKYIRRIVHTQARGLTGFVALACNTEVISSSGASTVQSSGGGSQPPSVAPSTSIPGSGEPTTQPPGTSPTSTMTPPEPSSSPPVPSPSPTTICLPVLGCF